MADSPGNGRPLRRVRRRLRGRLWFAELTASTLATVIGIGLTFGIDSCVRQNRERQELRKSMLQAVDNLGERFEDTRLWMDKILAQNRVYVTVDSIYYATGDIPDSLCLDFRKTMPMIKISAYDHDFEKIFRGSYQLWQLQSASDSLAYYISQCYDGLNGVETTCKNLTEELVEQMGVVNASHHFVRQSPREWTLSLLTDPRFQYYMSTRRAKAMLASSILDAAEEDYRQNVVPRSRALER